MAERRSQRQLRDRALFLHEKQQKSVSAVAFAFGVSKATMQRWLAQARSERRALMKDGVAGTDQISQSP